jgi:glycine/D-amino acid oxidase-like deaminating enzyme
MLNTAPHQVSLPSQVDFLIIGGGLAGCIMAWTLRQAGKSLCIIDEPRISSASRIGAGIINPISGKRFSSIWNSANVLPAALQCYANIEQHFQQKFLRKIATVRLFGNEEEQAFWEIKRASHQTFASLLLNSQIPSGVQAEFGGLGYTSWQLDTEKIVERLRAFYSSNGVLYEEVFDEQFLYISSDSVRYKECSAKNLVFCNGWKQLESSLWSNIWRLSPLSPAKGELLTVKLETIKPEMASIQHSAQASTQASLDVLIVKGIFLLPMENGTIRIGATYEWDDLTENTTNAAQEELLKAAQQIYPLKMQVLSHVAGVRPAARDSKPVLGLHPTFPHCAMINGLGAKGAVFAPFAAEHLLSCIEKKSEISAEISLKRFL